MTSQSHPDTITRNFYKFTNQEFSEKHKNKGTQSQLLCHCTYYYALCLSPMIGHPLYYINCMCTHEMMKDYLNPIGGQLGTNQRWLHIN